MIYFVLCIVTLEVCKRNKINFKFYFDSTGLCSINIYYTVTQRRSEEKIYFSGNIKGNIEFALFYCTK